jgi:hypothetical protein
MKLCIASQCLYDYAYTYFREEPSVPAYFFKKSVLFEISPPMGHTHWPITFAEEYDKENEESGENLKEKRKEGKI